MSVERNKNIVRRQFELLNAGDVKAAAARWAPVAFNHGRRVNPKMIESVYASLRLLQERHSLHEIIAEGEWVAVRTTCDGLHSARPEIPVNSAIFDKVEPTGRKYTAQHMHLFRIVNGKITEHWANRDDLGAARQVGLELGRAKG
jgi:ketosteroid isomerase-like protein